MMVNLLLTRYVLRITFSALVTNQFQNSLRLIEGRPARVGMNVQGAFIESVIMRVTPNELSFLLLLLSKLKYWKRRAWEF